MATESQQTIKLFVLGDARIETGIATIEPDAEIAFATALYFIMERHSPVARRGLEALLWPNLAPSISSHRFRQTLLKVRRLGIPIEPVGKYRLRLNGQLVSVDFDDLLPNNASKPSEEVSGLVVLPGYEPKFSPSYLEWLDEKKAELHGRLTRMMLAVIAQQRAEGNWDRVELCANHLLVLAPYNEEATLALAEAHAMRGSKIEGQRILDDYLAETGSVSANLRLPAAVMRRRIADRMPPKTQVGSINTPLVGRGRVMMRLSQLLLDLRNKEGRACLIRGEAGIGKTRLMAEFAAFAALQGVITQRVQCRSSDPLRPLSVFVDLVPLLQSMRGAIGCSPETIAHLERLTKHRVGDASYQPGEGDPQFVYARIERALFDLVEAVSDETPIVILFEDVHWIDDVSRKVLMHMVEWSEARPVMLAFTSRSKPDLLSGQAMRIVEIELPPLDVPSSTDLILGVTGRCNNTIDGTYLEWCVSVAEGNPFFLEELANQWVETGSAHSAPPSLTAVLEQRISRLSNDALHLLQTCALLENHATFDRIEKILGYEPHRLLLATNTLGAVGMLTSRRAESEGRGAYALLPRHELLAMACLARLAEQAHAFLHRRVATVLEAEVGDNTSAAILWDCAKHWQLAGDSGRAFSLARSCGLHLLEMGLPTSAADAFDKALQYCSSSEERLAILTDQAKAFEQSGSWTAVKRVTALARGILEQIDPLRHRHDELELRSLRAQWKTGESQRSLESVLQCLVSDEASVSHRLKAGAMALMLQDVLGLQQDMPKVHTIIQGLSGGVLTVPARLEAEIVYHTLCGSLTKAVDVAEALISIQRQNDDQGDLFRHLCNASVTYRTAGIFSRAESCLLEAATLAASHNLPGSLAKSLAMLGHLNLEQGNTEAANEFHNRLLGQSATHDDIYVNLDIASLGARIALLDRNSAGASACYRRTLSEIIQDPVGQRRTYALALYVSIQMTADEPVHDDVLSSLESAHIMSRRCIAQAFGAYVLHAALIKTGRLQNAKTILHEYHTVYRREPWIPEKLFGQVMAFARV